MHCNIKPLAILSFDIEPLAIQFCRKHSTVRITDMADKLARYVVVVAEIAAEVAAEVAAEIAAEVAAEVLAEVLAKVLAKLEAWVEIR